MPLARSEKGEIRHARTTLVLGNPVAGAIRGHDGDPSNRVARGLPMRVVGSVTAESATRPQFYRPLFVS